LTEVRDSGNESQRFDFELLVTNISLAGPSGIRAREYWQNPSMAKWTVSANEPGEVAGPSVTFQIDDSQKQHFQVGRRVRITIEPT
jgi:hypothetical protein